MNTSRRSTMILAFHFSSDGLRYVPSCPLDKLFRLFKYLHFPSCWLRVEAVRSHLDTAGPAKHHATVCDGGCGYVARL